MAEDAIKTNSDRGRLWMEKLPPLRWRRDYLTLFLTFPFVPGSLVQTCLADLVVLVQRFILDFWRCLLTTASGTEGMNERKDLWELKASSVQPQQISWCNTWKMTTSVWQRKWVCRQEMKGTAWTFTRIMSKPNLQHSPGDMRLITVSQSAPSQQILGKLWITHWSPTDSHVELW